LASSLSGTFDNDKYKNFSEEFRRMRRHFRIGAMGCGVKKNTNYINEEESLYPQMNLDAWADATISIGP
jgi:hypothetical protein